MAYQLRSNENIADGIRRIIFEQIDQAYRQLLKPSDDLNETVHDIRKCFKKVRACLRLMRDEIGEDNYKRENLCYRDAGRILSGVRDSIVLVDTLVKLHDHFSKEFSKNEFRSIRQKLITSHQEIIKRIINDQKSLERVAEIIKIARPRIADLPLKHDNFSAVRPGLLRIYTRGSNAMNNTFKNPTPENFHDWRKRAKYLWYHVRILKPIKRHILIKVVRKLDQLGELLGREHDLFALRLSLSNTPELCNSELLKTKLLTLINHRQFELRSEAWKLGQTIYIETPEQFTQRLSEYWKVWNSQKRN